MALSRGALKVTQAGHGDRSVGSSHRRGLLLSHPCSILRRCWPKPMVSKQRLYVMLQLSEWPGFDVGPQKPVMLQVVQNGVTTEGWLPFHPLRQSRDGPDACSSTWEGERCGQLLSVLQSQDVMDCMCYRSLHCITEQGI